jgi:hypothetical protein
VSNKRKISKEKKSSKGESKLITVLDGKAVSEKVGNK